MKKLYVSKVHMPFFLILIAAFSIRTAAQTFTPVTARITKHIGGYWEYLPHGYDSSSPKKYPLLLYFHGIGEIGNGDFYDLKKLLKNDIPRLIAYKKFPDSFIVNKDTFQFVIICPQLSVSGRTWTEIDDFVDSVVSRYNIDQSRMYIMGLSYGGGTAMFYCTDSTMGSNRFAAFATASQNLVVRDVPLKNLMQTELPIWFAVNKGDHVVLPSTTTDWVDRIKKTAYQPQPLLDIFDTSGHDAWSHMFSPKFRPRGLNIYEWMLQYRRQIDSLHPSITAPDTVYLPVNSIVLNGSSSTGGRIMPIASYEWQYVNGPGHPSFQSQATPITSVQNLLPGLYTFRLTVKNSSGTMFSTNKRVVVVRNMLPVAVVSADSLITLPVDSVSLNGTSSHDSDGYIVSYAWQQVSGPKAYDNVKDVSGPVLHLQRLVEGSYSFALTVTDNRKETASDTFSFKVLPPVKPIPVITGDTAITLPVDSLTLSGTSSFNTVGNITSYNWQYISGPFSYTFGGGTNEQLKLHHLVEGSYTFTLTVGNSGGGFASDTFRFVVHPPKPPVKPVAIIKGDTLVTLPVDSIVLSGNASFDTVAAITSYKWQYVAGPQSFGISDSSKSSVNINRLVVGMYVISLTVMNSQGGSSTDTFSFLVRPDSLPAQKKPVAIIQGDTLVNLPADSVRLTGLSSYDLSGNIRKYLWKFISGPTELSIVDSLSPSITLHNLSTGIYTISLTVTNDLGKIAQDTFRFDVSRSYQTNPPVAVIFGSSTIVLPVNSLSLDGRYSYSSGDSITSYKWQYVSGPQGFSVSDTTLPDLTIQNLSEGAYVFKLIVYNSHGVSAADSINFLVLRKQGGGDPGMPSLQIVTKPGLTLAPVPANSYLGVYLNDSTTGKLSIRIVDMNGRIVVRKENETKATASWKTIMNVANLATGSYFVEVIVGKEFFRGRFIK
ncbi:PKD domain-containing protein [Danxiaibacter flavus]|uniref:PKD domain-containing protein n=1 Tax=Danxiaibacter flavus TaxID=3049108 RepID=A0ABV3ZJX0_9BACT|nr:PKD domain-containing protein [Chitinophagaceae bacterium DXS]